MNCGNCPPGPLTTLCQTLNGLIAGDGTLTITPSTVASASVTQLFSDFLLNADLVLADAQVAFPEGVCSQLQMTGTASSAPFASMAVSATFTHSSASNEIELTLVATQRVGATAAWTLSQAFPTLAGTTFDQVTIASPTLTLDSAGAAGQQFQFGGEVPISSLAAAPLFSGADSLAVTGFITGVDAVGPTFDVGSTSTAALSLGGLFRLAPQFTLQSSVPAQATQPSTVVGVDLDLTIGSESLTVTALLPFDATYDFLSNADDTLDFGFEVLSSLTGLDFTALMPTQISLPGNFSLQSWELSLQMSSLDLVSFGLTACTTTSWPILSSITLDSLTFTFSDSPALVPPIFVSVGATLTLGKDANPAVLALSATGPAFAFSGELVKGEIDLDALVSTFSPDVGGVVPSGLAVSALFFSVAPSSAAYQFDVTLSVGWPLGLSDFQLEGVSFAFSDTAGVITASASGTVELGTTTVTVSAAYDPAGWTFTGTVTDFTTADLASLLTKYFPDLAKVIGTLNLTIESLTVSLAPTGYTFDIDVIWKIAIADDSLEVDATIHLVMPKGTTGPTGTIAGTASYNNSLPLTVTATLTGGELSQITLMWGSFTATIDPGASTATFDFKDLNVGRLITEATDVISPGYSLTAPWNLLNSFDLPEFEVVIDFRTKQAILAIDVGIELVFVSVNSVAMTIDWTTKAVSFSIPTGTFLGIPLAEPLVWDVVPPATGPAKPAPAVPGIGSAVFKLQFLALAQHFAPATAIDESSVTSAIAGLQTAFGSTTPGQGVTYDASVDWVIVVQATLLGGAASIGAVFYDPGLYGLALSVGASPNSPLSQLTGLDFEVLYKKVSPGLGVYQVDVTLPASISTIQLGAVSVTLPSIGVTIYTNGDFLIDFGFPKNGDFSHSCTLQMLPFTGAGGFYFGVLPPAAVPSLPQTTLGTFNPVIAFGIGVQVGLGKTVSYGILAGGLTITVEGIIEGVFATFNPSGGSAGSGDLFYTITGQVAIVGHLYGSVNFAIISARFDVLISVSASIEMTACQPALLNMVASVAVSVTARIDLGIFSISIDLSFSASIHEQFQIGSGSVAPWETQRDAERRLSLLARPSAGVSLSWAPVTLSPRQGVSLLLVPNPAAASAIVGGEVQSSDAQIVVMTYIDYTPEGTTPIPKPASSFAALAEGILLWAVSAGISDGKTVPAGTILGTTVTLEQINGIFDALSATPFQWTDVKSLLANYFDFTITQPVPNAGAPVPVGVFPIFPVLSMTLPDRTIVDFATCNTATAAQLAAIQEDFGRMQPAVPFASGGGSTPGDASASVATFLFVDYVLLVCKGVLQAASDLLAASGGTNGLTVATIVTDLNDKLGLDGVAPQAARVFLQGLRPPWPTPADPPQALYAISGQQLDASKLVSTDTITLSFPPDSFPPDAAWASFVGDAGTITIGTLATTLGALNGASISPALTSQPAEPVDSVAMQFTLVRPAIWSQGTESWTTYAFPPRLLHILADSSTLQPVMQLGELDPSGAAVPAPSTFSWMTSFTLDVALVPSAASASTPIANTYNVLGTDAAGGAFLQALFVAAAGGGVTITQIYITYPPTPGGTGLTSQPTGTGTATTQFFLVQTNLSTESNPGHAAFATFGAAAGVEPAGQTSLELLQAVWECSVVRSGGYFLYFADPSGNGLPTSLFAADGRAELTIIVTYDASASDPLQPFMNGIVVEESIAPKTNLYLQAVSSNVLTDASDTTLGELARRSRKTVYQVIRGNAGVAIEAGEDVLVPRERGLDAVVVRLDAPASMADIARRENVSLSRLARANRDRKLRFATPLSLDPILQVNAQTMSTGCAGFVANAAPEANAGSDAQGILDQQFQLLGYQIAPTSAFEQSPFGLPLSPADAPADGTGTVYRAAMPVFAFATDTGVNSGLAGQPLPLNDPYRGIGETVQFALNWQDVFGNVVTTLPPAGANPYNVEKEILFFDKLIALSQWPAIGMSYRIAVEEGGTTPQLSILLTFDSARYVGASSDLLRGDQAAFAAIYYQIARNATITVGSTLDATLSWNITSELIDFVVAVYAYITSLIAGSSGTVPVPPLLVTTIGDTSGSAFFQLQVGVTIARPADLIDPSVHDPLLSAIESVVTTIRPTFLTPPPPTDPERLAPGSSTATLLRFATDLQACFATLMVAVGIPDSTTATEEVWVVRFGASGYQFTFGEPAYFALPPLALAPLSLTAVPILEYSSGTPIASATPVNTAFSNVNLDQLASSFLSSIDLFLGPDLVVPAWKTVVSSGSTDNPVADILTTKATLAAAIASMLQQPLFSPNVSPQSTSPQPAIAKLEQELLIQLSAAYQINTVVSVPVTPLVAPGAPELSLYGKPTAPAGTAGVYAFSAASLPLGAEDPAVLTFTFSTTDPQEASLVELPVTYRINNCQFGFAKLPAPLDTFTASSWLTFAMPFTSASAAVQAAVAFDASLSLGIPVPLRAFPTTPSISLQKAAAAPLPAPPTVASTRLWNYSFEYNYAAASQDDIHATVTLTPPAAATSTTSGTVSPFAQALLQFSVSWPLLLADFASSTASVAVNAMQWLSALAQSVADSWSSLPPPVSLPPFDFLITSEPGPDGQLQVTVAIESGDGTVVPWIEIDGYKTTAAVAATGQTYEFTDPNGAQLTYEQALTIPARTVCITPPDLSAGASYDVLVQPMAWAAVSVARNEVYGTLQGNTSFIYSTPFAQQVNPAVPLLALDVVLDLAASTTVAPPQPLAAYLTNFLTALFTTLDGSEMTPQTIQLSCGYSYPVASGLIVTVPILLTTPAELNPTDPLIATLAAQAEGWLANATIAEGAQLVFGVSLFGANSSSPGSSSLPLLQLDAALAVSNIATA